MADYASLKVPDLKKLLQERGLPQSGNKADLIARLQDNDKSQVEDVIDWDDDDTKIAALTANKEDPKPAPAPEAKKETPAAPAPAPAHAPAHAEPAEPAAPAAAEASETETKETDGTPAAAPSNDDGDAATTADEKPADTASSFALGLEASNADDELKKREARLKRFGTATDPESEEAKKADRAKKFGVDTTAVVEGLDSALPERRPKRGRDRGDDGEGGGKRQSLDRRNGGGRTRFRGGRRGGGRPNKQGGGGGGGGGAKNSSIFSNPTEKAKAEARAKRFSGDN